MWRPSWMGHSHNHPTMLWFAPCEVSRTQGKTLKAQQVRAAISNNVVRTHFYPHPHHMKLEKHHIWVWFWCGSHFEWVYSLNHLITIMWFAPWEVSRIQGKTLKAWLVRAAISNNMVRTHSHAHLHHMKVWNTSDVFDFDVEAKLNGTIASITVLSCDLTLKTQEVQPE
jgi:hypothetical protein